MTYCFMPGFFFYDLFKESEMFRFFFFFKLSFFSKLQHIQVTVSCQDTFEIGKTLDETRDLNHFKSSFKTLVKKKSLIRK